MIVIINVGDDYYFSTVLKMHFDSEIARFLRHRAKPLRFFTVYCTVYRIVHKATFLCVQHYSLHPITVVTIWLCMCISGWKLGERGVRVEVLLCIG
jgi:hypothetical protein